MFVLLLECILYYYLADLNRMHVCHRCDECGNKEGPQLALRSHKGGKQLGIWYNWTLNCSIEHGIPQRIWTVHLLVLVQELARAAILLVIKYEILTSVAGDLTCIN